MARARRQVSTTGKTRSRVASPSSSRPEPRKQVRPPNPAHPALPTHCACAAACCRLQTGGV